MDDLHQIPLFDGITDDEYAWLLANSTEMMLERGAYLFREGDVVEHFYIVLEGEMQVTRRIMGQDTVMGTIPRGIIGGELPILDNTLIMPAASLAILPTRLMVFTVQAFREIFARVPAVGARILAVATERMANIAGRARTQEKMTALGNLASGLAHELNNPAAAARRAANGLRGALYDIQLQAIRLTHTGLSDTQLQQLLAVQQDAIRANRSEHLAPLEYSDRETAIADWLEAKGIDNVWEMAAVFVGAGVTVEDLDALIAGIGISDPAEMLTWMCTAFTAASLVQELEVSTRRISDLIEKVKGYTYMDEAPVQDIDIHAGLDNTLTVLRPRLQNRTIIREYDPTLPRVLARGVELNQVWTNLLENAIEATPEDGVIRVITRHENDYAMVEINDNGTGIPQQNLARIWEPFFTTKDPAQHTGLGLDMVYRVIRGHSGMIECRPEPGKTRFIIRLATADTIERS
jgi:signal transduction histidine kinase